MATFDNRRAEAARDEEELLSSPRQSNRPLILAFVGLVLMLGGYAATNYTPTSARQAETERRLAELRLLAQQRQEAGANDDLAAKLDRVAEPRRDFPYPMAGRLAIYGGLFLFVLAGIQMYHSSPPPKMDDDGNE